MSLTTNVNQNIKEAIEFAPILCQAIPQVIFHPDVPDFFPNVLTDGEKWPALSASAKTVHAIEVLANTAAPNIATPVAVVSVKINSNHSQPT